MQLIFSWAPKQAKSVRVNIGCPVIRTDGRSAVGVRSRDYKFSGMGRFTKLWSSAIKEYYCVAKKKLIRGEKTKPQRAMVITSWF